MEPSSHGANKPDPETIKAAARQALTDAQVRVAIQKKREKEIEEERLAGREPMTPEQLEEYASQFEKARCFEEDDDWVQAYINAPMDDAPPSTLTSPPPAAPGGYQASPSGAPNISTLNSNASVFSPRRTGNHTSAAAVARAAPYKYGAIGSGRPNASASGSPTKTSRLQPTAPQWNARTQSAVPSATPIAAMQPMTSQWSSQPQSPMSSATPSATVQPATSQWPSHPQGTMPSATPFTADAFGLPPTTPRWTSQPQGTVPSATPSAPVQPAAPQWTFQPHSTSATPSAAAGFRPEQTAPQGTSQPQSTAPSSDLSLAEGYVKPYIINRERRRREQEQRRGGRRRQEAGERGARNPNEEVVMEASADYDKTTEKK